MAEIQTGFFWHVHHEVLIEWCYDYDGRASFIRSEKRENEQETRLRLFKPVKGILPQEVVEAGQALDEARQTYRALQVLNKEAGQVLNEAWRAYNEAWQVYYRAGRVYDAALRKNMSAIEALHREECHNCPWNGKTIFPKA